MKSRRSGMALAVAAVAAVSLAGIGTADAEPVPKGDESTVIRGEIRADGSFAQTRATVPIPLVKSAPSDKAGAPATPAAPPVKLDRALAAAAGNPAAKGRVEVILTFRQDLKAPAFPALDPGISRTAPANAQKRAQADSMIAGITAQRAAGYRAISADLQKLDVRTLETFWLMKALRVDAPASALPALAARDDITYIQPVSTGTKPPADADPDNDEFWARFIMRTDQYFNLGLSGGFVGVLDTGVRSTHTMFNSPGKPWIREDMVNTTNPNPDDDFWNHGTSTIGVLTGNGNLTSRLRGVTGITVDSFKVYSNAGGEVDATMRGFQRAIQVGDRVIVAELQFGTNGYDSVQVMADQAYDAGAVVVAANGNFGQNPDGTIIPGSVNSPAAAQKVLGIGAVDVKTQATNGSQSRGPAADGRTKPDLQAATNVETASNASDTATQVFTGTSGATPQAGGAAALVRNLLRGSSVELNPGAVYAFMIAAGNAPNGSAVLPPTNNDSGAGIIKLPVGGHFTSSARTIGGGQTALMPITVEAGDANSIVTRLDVAIWWPEAPTVHNDMDLTLVDPNGVVRGSSVSVNGVFERVRVFGPLTPGNWTARVSGFSVLGGTQEVHLSAQTTQSAP